MTRGARTALVAITLGLGALVGCGESKPPQREAAPPAVAVRTITVEPTSVPVEVEAVGTVRASITTMITANLTAHVVEVRVREGSRVAAGDLLVRLDEADLRAQRARAEATRDTARLAREELRDALAEARARVDEARAGLDGAAGGVEGAQGAIAEAEAAVAAAEAQATLAGATLARYRQMFEERALAPQEYDEVVARDRTARAELDRARARLEGARSALARERSHVAQATSAIEAARGRVQALESGARTADARIREAEAAIARVDVHLGYARVTAPGPGIVVARSVEVGELAAPGRSLLTLDHPSRYRLEAQLPSSHVAAVRPGQRVEVSIDALSSQPLAGRVVEIVPAADPATRTVTVKVEVEPVDGIRSGLYGRARFVVGRAQRVFVPAAAVVERGQLTGLYVVADDGVARLRFVTLGERRGDGVEALSGVTRGERIAVDGLGRLKDGIPVVVSP